ncbi:hypothetical protein PGT21_008158 [Puccinia graminis f. sp. tritici]|uniref:Uncharacterized protein n=1 Tax=Puccinia graminis f. sp. tritici TaxID=56615 RepID=A0A5B0NTH9_PUCGR|nr:hypothetical protein PGT21_008158 [Puccinia graminis f. sp. tritici]KAA1093695.1 hypothetical protein PGTUg99_020981 [Puccinia graminis f. sp. tritici]
MVAGGGSSLEAKVGANECSVSIGATANGTPQLITNKLIADSLPIVIANIAPEGITTNTPVFIANIAPEPIAGPISKVIANGPPVVITNSAPVLISPVGTEASTGANNKLPAPVVLIADKLPEFNTNNFPEFNTYKLPEFNTNIFPVVIKVESSAGANNNPVAIANKDFVLVPWNKASIDFNCVSISRGTITLFIGKLV